MSVKQKTYSPKTYSAKTYSPKASEIERSWWLVDADSLVIGRMSTEIARLLQGKHKATYAPHMDSGDYVVVVNAEKAVFSGDKDETKVHYRHSGYPGGLKTSPYAKTPAESLRRTIKGMLPKTRLGRQQYKKLMVYEGAEHPHGAQNPESFAPLALKTGGGGVKSKAAAAKEKSNA